MAYLPSDVLKKLREAAANGSKSAQNALKASGNVNNKPVTPAQTAPNSQPTSPLQQILSQTNPSEQATVPAWVKALEDKNKEQKEEHNAAQDKLNKILEESAESAKKIQEQSDKARAIRESGSYYDAENADSDEPIDHIQLDTAQLNSDAVYKVNIIDSSNIEFANSDSIELWCIDDKRKGVHKGRAISDTITIGKENLDGAQEGADYVIYDKRTNQLYQYATTGEDADNLNKITEAEQKYNKMYYSQQESLAELMKTRESLLNKIYEKCDEYGIDLNKESDDSQFFNLLAPLSAEFAANEEKIDQLQYSTNRALDTQKTYLENLKSKTDVTKAVSVNDYLIAQATVQKYKDIQAVMSGEMSRQQWLAQYNYSPTVQEMNSLAQDAIEAQYVLDNAGTIVDIGNVQTNEFNDTAHNRLEFENNYEQQLIDIAVNGEDGKYYLDMTNNHQLNSDVDIIRKLMVNLIWDAPTAKDKLISVAEAADDFKQVRQLWADTITATDKYGAAQPIKGLGALILNNAMDVGELATGYVNAIMNSTGFNGKEGYKYIRSDGTEGIFDAPTKNEFADGVLQNADYYMAKADTRDYVNTLGIGEQMHQKLTNIGVAMEAQMRGDLPTFSVFNTENINLQTGENYTLEFTQNHPVLSIAADVAAGIMFDPTSYFGLIKGANWKETEAGRKLVDNYTDAILGVGRKNFVDISEETEKAVRAVVENSIDTGLAMRGTQKLEESGIVDTMNLLMKDEHAIDLLENFGDGAESVRQFMIRNLYDDTMQSIEQIATADSKLWEDAYNVVKHTQTWEQADKLWRDIQFGFAPELITQTKELTRAFRQAMNFGTRKLANVTDNVSNYLIGLLQNTKKAFDGGLVDLPRYVRDTNNMRLAVKADIFKEAFKRSKTTQEVLDSIYNLDRVTNVTRSRFIGDTITTDIDNLSKALFDSSKMSKIDEVLNLDAATSRDIVGKLKKSTTLNSDNISEIVKTYTKGRFSNLSEYAEYVKDLAKSVDSNDITAGVYDRVNRQFESLVDNINNINKREAGAKYLALKCAIDEDNFYHVKSITLDDVIGVHDNGDLITSNFNAELQNLISDVYAAQGDAAARAAAVRKIDKLADDYANAIGATYSIKYAQSLQEWDRVEKLIREGNYVAMSAEEYLNHAAQQYGIRLSEDDCKKICREAISKFDDAKAAGRYYRIIESSEQNLNGILDNKELSDLFNPDNKESRDIIKYLTELDGNYDPYNIRFSDGAVKKFQHNLYENLVGVTSDPVYTYHMIMDSFAGHADELNKLFRDFSNTNSKIVRDSIVDEMTSTILDHANKVHMHNEGIKLIESSKEVREALYNLCDNTPLNYNMLVPTRDSVYNYIAKFVQDIDEHLADVDNGKLSLYTMELKFDRDGVLEIKNKLQLILNKGKYTTSNSDLGMIINGKVFDDLISQASGVDGVHIDQLKELMSASADNGFKKSFGLYTVFDAEHAKQYVTQNIVDATVHVGDAACEQLEDYTKCWDLLYNNLIDHGVQCPSLYEIKSIRSALLSQAKNTVTDPACARYLDYLWNMDFKDPMKCTAMLVDAQARLGLDVHITNYLLNKIDPKLTEVYSSIVETGFDGISRNKVLHTIVDVNNSDLLKSELAKVQTWDKMYKSSKDVCDTLAVRSAINDIINDGDVEAKLAYRKQADIATEIKTLYNGFNDDKGLKGKALEAYRRKQYITMRGMEDSVFSSMKQGILSMQGDSLDSFLLHNGNYIVCDVTDNKVAEWLTRRELDGYIVTHTQLNGKDVSILSLDFDALDAGRKDYLINRMHTRVGTTFGDAYDREAYTSVVSAWQATGERLGADFTHSTGYRTSAEFADTIQGLLPDKCKVSADIANSHRMGYVSNLMLGSSDDAIEIGATKGHMLGNWFYADVAGTRTNAMKDDLATMVAGTQTKFKDIYKDMMIGIRAEEYRWNVERFYTEMSNQLRDSHSHIVTLELNEDAVGQSYKFKDYTDLFTTEQREFMHKYHRFEFKDARLQASWDSAVVGSIPSNAIIVDDDMFRYINGQVKSINSAYIYASEPKLLQTFTDVLGSIRSAYISQQLYLSNILGTGMRNVIDSNIKALNELGLDNTEEYMANWWHMEDIQANYVKRMTDIYEETGITGTDAMYAYFKNHPELDGNDFAELQKLDLAFSHTGTAEDEMAKEFRRIRNNKLLDGLSTNYSKAAREEIIKAFDAARDSHWIRGKVRSNAKDYDILLKELKKRLGNTLDENQINEIAKLYGNWSTGNVEHWYTKMFSHDNKLGCMLSKANKDLFDTAETRCRNAMMLTLMDKGESAISANAKVIKTQFDYGTSRGLTGAWDKIMPFSKYQFANAGYWLNTYNYSGIAFSNARRFASALGYTNSSMIEDEARKQAAYAYIKAHSDYKQNDDYDTFMQAMNDIIEDYKGVDESQAFGISLGNGHYLKVGNGMVDTYNWLSSVMAAPYEIANGKFPTILKDTLFSPVRISAELLPELLGYLNDPLNDDKFKALGKFSSENYYDLLSCIPVIGNTANIILTSMRNFSANKSYMAIAMGSKGLTELTYNELCNAGKGLGATLLPSIFGTKHENKKVFTPIKNEDGSWTYYSDLTEDEKSRYLYLPGISSKSTYNISLKSMYGLYGRLAEMGFDKRDIKNLANSSLYRNASIYNTVDGKTYIDKTKLETTVVDMLEHGYSLREVQYLLICNTSWYDFNTHTIIKSSPEMEKELLSAAFLEGYQAIPDYIKYQPDMYKEMMERYKALGMTTAEAWRVMATNPAYIDEQGYFEYLNDRQVNDYSSWVKNEYFEGQQDDGFLQWYSQLPEYIKYEKGAYSRTLAYLKQMFTSDEAKQMIANGAYYTVDGRLIDCKGLSRTQTKASGAFQDEAGYWHKAGDFQYDGYWYHKGDNPYLGLGSFQNYWNTLPDYLRYTKGAWSQTNSVLKEAGIDYNTRMKAMQDGAYAVQVDPNSDYFKELLAKQNLVSITKTVYVTKEVPLRECTQVNGEWVWNGAQSIKCDDNGNGYSVELIQKNLEFNAAGLGVTEAAKWKSYDAAMVTVKVPQTITEVGQDPNQIMYRIVTDKDGRTWVIVPCPPYNKPPRGGYYKKGYPQKYWNKYHKDKFKKNKRFYTTRGYVNTNQKPMKIDYSNVRTYSKQHFLQQQGLGYKYWAQWGDGRIENHRNRYGRKVAPSTYRNPRAKQRSMYKDMYAKYGASRMNMRQNIAGYSNASVTRLRRNEIANRTYNLRMRNKI